MRLALLGLLVAVAYLPIISAVSTPRWIFGGVASFAIFVFVSVRPTRAHLLGAAMLAWCAATAVWSVSPEDALGRLMQLAVLGAAFCVAAEVDGAEIKPFWIALGAGASVSAVAAVLQINGVSAFQPYGDWVQPTGMFGNKNVMANFGVLALIGMLSVPQTWWTAPLTAGSAVAAFLPASRGAAIAFCVAIGALLWRRAGWRLWAFLLVAVAAAAVALGLDAWFNPGRTASSSARLEMWDWTVTNLSVFGWGIGNYGAVFPFEHASNDVLELAFELGVGLAVAVALVAHVLGAPGRKAEWAVLVAFLVLCLVTFPFHQPATAFVAAMVAGRLAGARRDAWGAELGGRVVRVQGLPFSWPIGVGAIHEADLRRQAVPVRSERPNGGREVQARRGSKAMIDAV